MRTHNTNTHVIHIHMGYSLYTLNMITYIDTIQKHMGYTYTWDTLCMMTRNTNAHGIHIHLGHTYAWDTLWILSVYDDTIQIHMRYI